MPPFPLRLSARGASGGSNNGRLCDGFRSALDDSTVPNEWKVQEPCVCGFPYSMHPVKLAEVLKTNPEYPTNSIRGGCATRWCGGFVPPRELLGPPTLETWCACCNEAFSNHQEFKVEEIDQARSRPLPPEIAAAIQAQALVRPLQQQSVPGANPLGSGSVPGPGAAEARGGNTASEMIAPYIRQTNAGNSNERRNASMEAMRDQNIRDRFGVSNSQPNNKGNTRKKGAKAKDVPQQTSTTSTQPMPPPSMGLTPPPSMTQPSMGVAVVKAAKAASATPTTYLYTLPLTTTLKNKLIQAEEDRIPYDVDIIDKLGVEQRDLERFVRAGEEAGLVYAPTVSDLEPLWPQLTNQTVRHLHSQGYLFAPGRSGNIDSTEYGVGPFEFLLKPSRGQFLQADQMVPIDIDMPWYHSRKGKYIHPYKPNCLIAFLVLVGGNARRRISGFPNAGCPKCRDLDDHGCYAYRWAALLGMFGPYTKQGERFQKVECHVAYCPPCDGCGRHAGDALVASLDQTSGLRRAVRAKPPTLADSADNAALLRRRAISDSAEENPRPLVRQREENIGDFPNIVWDGEDWYHGDTYVKVVWDYEDTSSNANAVASSSNAVASSSNAVASSSNAVASSSSHAGNAAAFSSYNAAASSSSSSNAAAAASSIEAPPVPAFMAYNGEEAKRLRAFIRNVKQTGKANGRAESMDLRNIVVGPKGEESHKAVAACVWVWLLHEFEYLVKVDMAKEEGTRKPRRSGFTAPQGFVVEDERFHDNFVAIFLADYPFRSKTALGSGFNTAVRWAALDTVKAQTTMWQNVGSKYLVINPQPNDGSIKRQAMFRAAGWVFAWVTYHDVAGLGSFSPLMLMMLLSPSPAKFVISPELLSIFEPEGAKELGPWLNLGPKERLASAYATTDKVRGMIIEAGGDPDAVNALRMNEDSGETHRQWSTQFLLSQFFGLGQGAVDTFSALPSFQNMRRGFNVLIGAKTSFVKLFNQEMPEADVTFHGMDITVPHHVTALCHSSLQVASQVTDRLDFEPSTGFADDKGLDANPEEEDCLKRLFILRLTEFLTGWGIPDHPDLRAFFPDAVNEASIQREATNPLHRVKLFLRAFSSVDFQSTVIQHPIMISFVNDYPEKPKDAVKDASMKFSTCFRTVEVRMTPRTEAMLLVKRGSQATMFDSWVYGTLISAQDVFTAA
ncbi:hypothetical protein EIP91_007466 [Steccherinum ochraceum]|uniref:Uncharacterized protein n=1 Tax=Steccherinum ochraceum TaxID=92696 RepID=A0A4R0R4D7_9APHY|nr:hypothetical protein EIP91_007466 [Steccherinum ochraceum]